MTLGPYVPSVFYMEITQSIGPYYGEQTERHIFRAIEDGEMIGELYVAIGTEVIMNIEVDMDRRGEGIARKLYAAADAALSGLMHAPEWCCTPEGQMFAEAVGGEVATDEDMAALGIEKWDL